MRDRTLTKEVKLMKDNIEGLVLDCKYAWCCEKAKSLGISEILLRFALGQNQDSEKIMELLACLDHYKFYLKIAELNNTENPFDAKIVSFYWKGSPNLNCDLYHNFTTVMPIADLPLEVIDPTIIDDCFVHPGKIRKETKGFFDIEYQPVIKEGGRLKLGKLTERHIRKGFIESQKGSGRFITFHFRSAVEEITELEAQHLVEITKNSLKKFNEKHLSALSK